MILSKLFSKTFFDGKLESCDSSPLGNTPVLSPTSTPLLSPRSRLSNEGVSSDVDHEIEATPALNRSSPSVLYEEKERSSKHMNLQKLVLKNILPALKTKGKSPPKDPLISLKQPLGEYNALDELPYLVNQNEDFSSTYDLGKKIGEGGFAAIYLCTYKETKQIYCVKIINFELLAKEETIQLLIRELRVLKLVNHPNLVSCYAIYLSIQTLHIVLEYCQMGSISSLLSENKLLNEAQIIYMCYSILQALNYLHTKGIMHRDIKSSNILLTTNGEIRLGDFGTCACFAPKIKRKSFIGTVFWMAPELVLNSTDVTPHYYDESIDIWSLGITVIECAEGNPPHTDLGIICAMHAIPNSEPPKLTGTRWSPQLKEFVSLCLKKDPMERPSVAYLLQHPIFNHVNNSAFLHLIRGRMCIQEPIIRNDNTSSCEKLSVSAPQFDNWDNWSWHGDDSIIGPDIPTFIQSQPDKSTRVPFPSAMQQIKNPIFKNQVDEIIKKRDKQLQQIRLMLKNLELSVSKIKKQVNLF